MKLYNTLSRNIEEFTPLNPPIVTFYTCGPTVYDYTHIGHVRTYIYCDLLRRTLGSNGFKVNHVMNVTDVGHLTDDGDLGEDKLEKGAKKQNKTVWEVAEFFTKYFFYTTDKVGVLRPTTVARATDHVPDMIEIVKQLIEKSFGYETKEAIYFDTSKLADYGKLTGQNLADKKIGVRENVVVDSDKKNPTDFVLWFKRVGKYEHHTMYWGSPWGDGFPGWHIECSAMSRKYLGDTIDIHAGGVDHIPVHHTNEIAQSEALTDKQFVKYWFHTEFLLVENQKMSKSVGNFYTIDDIIKKGFDPLALRYLFLQTHYRKQMNFTFDALSAAAEGYSNLKKTLLRMKEQEARNSLSDEKLTQLDEYRNSFFGALHNDLQTGVAVATMWEVLKSNIPSNDKYDLIMEFDEVLGLGLSSVVQSENTVPEEIKELANKRKQAKADRNFELADSIRQKINEMGYTISDNGENFSLVKI